MLFIIFFSIFIFVLTVWENIWLGVVVFGLILVGLLVFMVVKNCKKPYKLVKNRGRLKQIFFLFLAFFLACGCWFRKNNGFDFFKSSTTSWSPSFSKGGQNDGDFMGTGIIEDTYTQGKYIFSDGNSSYILYTKKEYTIGDQIFLMGRKSSGTFSGSTTEQGFLAFDYTKWLKMKGRKGVIYETNSSQIFGKKSSVSRSLPRKAGLATSFTKEDTKYQEANSGKEKNLPRIKQLKKNLQQKIISAYGKDRISGMVLGMLIGDRSQIPKDDYQGFIDSGLVHIIAVSGGNIVMITVFLGCILFFLPFYVRMFVILITVILYGLICGLDSSVFRAVVTGGLSLIALFRGKEIPIWRLLSIAFIGMLIVNPYYLVYDVGFLMSFAAVIGIILINQKPIVSKTAEIEELKDGKMERGKLAVSENRNPPSASHPPPFLKGGTKALLYIRKNYLQPSVGATCGVFPIIIFFMGKINLLSILTNLFILPILPFVMIYGFISVYLYQLLGRSRLLRIEKFLISYIYKVSEISSAFGLYLSMDGWVKWVVLMGFLGGFIYWKLKIRTSGGSPLPAFGTPLHCVERGSAEPRLPLHAMGRAGVGKTIYTPFTQ